MPFRAISELVVTVMDAPDISLKIGDILQPLAIARRVLFANCGVSATDVRLNR
jgi:hypothetical protein